jgi:threonine/homoserine/homoserine lactone efflux protein
MVSGMFALLPLFGVWLLAVVTPGPDFLVTVQYATRRSRRLGMLVGLGVASGILVWATGSMLGLSVLFARLSWLYDIVRFAGAAYLVYLGVRTLWSARRRNGGAARDVDPPEVDPVHADALPADPPLAVTSETGPGALRAWRVGFLTNISNPKAAAFFSSLLGALMPVQTGGALRVLVVAVLVCITLAWYTLVSALFGLAPVARLYRRARRWIDRVMAAVLIALGARLALDR